MRSDRDRFGSIVGVLVFGCGIALLACTFIWAYGLFSQPPDVAMGIQKGKTLDLSEAGRSAIMLGYRIALLLLMCVLGSVIANRGIKMYAAARAMVLTTPAKESKES